MPPDMEDCKGFREVFIKDQDGELQKILLPIPEAHFPDQEIEHDYLPALCDAPSFVITGKTAKRLILMIQRDINHGKRLYRNAIRKREQYRRASLKYGDLDKRTQLAMMLYQVAVERIKLWRGERHYGNEKVLS